MTRSIIPDRLTLAAEILAAEWATADKARRIALERITQAATIAPDALDRMVDALPGAATSRPPGSDGGGAILDDQGVPMPRVSDPTGEAGIRPDMVTADRTYAARLAATLVTYATQAATTQTKATAEAAEQIANGLLSILERWAPRHAHAGDRAKGDQIDICESCKRLTDRQGRATVSRVERSTDGTERPIRRTVSGKKRHLCQPCGNFARDHDRLPTLDELRVYHDGGRWRVRVA